MSSAQLNPEHFTYQDYVTWDDHSRWELVDGVRSMVPAPNSYHQSLSTRLIINIGNQLAKAGSPCQLFHAPYDVVFDPTNVVQPDLLIVCDPNKIKSQHLAGAPDCIFEILSPSTGAYDRTVKLELYERFGVGTYVIVHPPEGYLEVFALENGRYGAPLIYTREQTLTLSGFGLTIPLEGIFDSARG